MLVHGVGVGPESFASVAELLEDRHRVVVVDRPTGPGGTACSLVEQADRLTDLLVEVGAAGGRLVGVSGGATLSLHLAIHHPQVVGGLVLHEPLVGALAPELHQRFLHSAASAVLGDAEAMDVVRAVMGEPTWAALDPVAQAGSLDQAPRWRGEITEFAAFDPSVVELSALRTRPILTTIGAASGPERWAAAEVLRRWSGAELVEIPNAGNAVQLDAPASFAELIDSWQTVASEGAS